MRADGHAREPWTRILYVQVLIAVAIGILIGRFFPSAGVALQPLGDGFIKLVKMIIAPIVFCTIVHGVASMSDLRKLGGIGGKTLVYFEVVSTIPLLLALVVVNVLKPGAGFNIDIRSLDHHAVDASHALAASAKTHSIGEFLLNIIPVSFFEALTRGEILPVLFVALLTACSLNAMGERGKPFLAAIESAAELFFGIMRMIVRVAPLGALGAMAFTVGSFGLGSLAKLLQLMGSFYLAAILFVCLGLGLIARVAGFSIFRLIAYLREEIFLVFGTSSSESALPGMIRKMESLGCKPGTAGLVIPMGYSFNLDGTNIYLAMAAVFLAQATNTPLDFHQQMAIVLVGMLTSKGASAVTGGGFIALAATLSIVPSIPIESLALLVGVDRFMSEGRAVTNLIGNGVAALAISRWENEIPADELRSRLAALPSPLRDS